MLMPLSKSNLVTGVCISRPQALVLAPCPSPQFVFTSPGPQFYLTALAPNLYLQALALNMCKPTLDKNNSFTGPGP